MALHSSKYSNRQELRNRIVEVSMEQFSSKGIKNVTMDNISSLLGISKRTLYEIFPDKETLLVCGMELSEIKAQEYLKTVLESSKNVMEMVLHVYQNTITRFQSLNPSFLQEISKYPKAYQLYLDNREASSERAYQFFQEGVSQGLFRSDVNFVIVRALIRGQFNLLLHSDIYRSYSFLEVLEAIIFTFLRGICTEKGARILDDFIEERRNARKE